MATNRVAIGPIRVILCAQGAMLRGYISGPFPAPGGGESAQKNPKHVSTNGEIKRPPPVFPPPPPRPAPSMGWALGTGWWEGADGQARPDFTSTDPIPTSAGLDLGSRQGSRRPLFPPPPPPTWAPWRRVCHWGAFSGAADGSRRFVGPRSPPLSAACRAPTRIHPSRSPD